MRIKQITENTGSDYDSESDYDVEGVKITSEKLNGKIVRRAGIIPYIIDNDGNIHVYTMIPSDPDYGGTQPQIAKGKMHNNLTSEQTAWNEGEEELGLIKSNTKNFELLKVYPYNQDHSGSNDNLAVYIVEVIDSEKWNEPHYETGWSGWINITNNLSKIRDIQQNIFKDLHSHIKN
ncbi:hypothetical protein PBI_SCTP2_325 [Salicola phage SCTP-2]|nr:hypothetical protein PBI_SCTP2_325 [Salicola phage SCTP-2]